MRSLQFALVAVSVVVTVPAARAVTVISFDSITGMPNQPLSIVPAASRLSNQFVASGAIFSSASPFVAVVNLGVGHAVSGANGIGGVNASQQLAYASAITVTFVDPADPAAEGATTSVSVRGDMAGVNGQVTLQAFDRCGDLIASDVEIDTAGPLLSISMTGPARIHSVRFFSATANVAFDNFTFADVVPIHPGDIDGDAAIEIDDLLLVINAWGPCAAANCPADVNCSNAVDINDLLDVINNWGPVP